VGLIRGFIPVWAQGFSGSGYGDGSGDGSGSGSGSWFTIAWAAVNSWTDELKSKLSSAVDRGGFLAFWKSDKHGKASNNGSRDFTAEPGLVQEVQGPLRLCSRNALHATLHPDNWNGDRLWIVALYGEIHSDSDKAGALKREILGEVK